MKIQRYKHQGGGEVLSDFESAATIWPETIKSNSFILYTRQKTQHFYQQKNIYAYTQTTIIKT